MPDLRSVVCVKVVPKPEEVRVDPATRRLAREGVRAEINPPDMNALEMALGLKDLHGGRVTLVSMGPPSFLPHLQAGLAMGADHVCLLTDGLFAGADTLATTYTLARALRRLRPFDLVFCGEESSDGATGQVPSGLAEWLDLPLLSLVSEVTLDGSCGTIRARRKVSGGFEILEASTPALVSVRTASNEPRFMDYGWKSGAEEAGRLTTWSAEDLQCDPERIGQAGSPTVVAGLRQAGLRERRRERLTGSPDEIASAILERVRAHL